MSNARKPFKCLSSIAATGATSFNCFNSCNPILAKNQEYLASLELIHGECLEMATSEQKLADQKAKDNLRLD
jgi:hypothetical protein